MARKPAAAPKLPDGAFIALGPVLHNGESYDAGDVLDELTEAEAASLLAAGAIEAAFGFSEPAAPAA